MVQSISVGFKVYEDPTKMRERCAYLPYKQNKAYRKLSVVYRSYKIHVKEQYSKNKDLSITHVEQHRQIKKKSNTK